jgi:hypothetical protein
MRNADDWAPIFAQVGRVEGQSLSAAHWVHWPLVQSEATAPLVELGCGQSVDVVHDCRLPFGAAGSSGQLDDPHQFGQYELRQNPGGIGETYDGGGVSSEATQDQTV